MKAKNIQCGQELEVRVVNANYNDHAVEVQILEGSFKGQRTIVEKSDLVIAKYTVKAECKKYENEDSYKRTLWDSDYHRSLSFELTVTCEDEATQDYIVEKINNTEMLSCKKPDGAFYIMINISKMLGKVIDGNKINNSIDFSNALLNKEKVAIIPGSGFGTSNYVRISYAASMNNVKEGIKRIIKFVEDCK